MWASFVQNTPCQYQAVNYLFSLDWFISNYYYVALHGKISVIIHHQPIIGGYSQLVMTIIWAKLCCTKLLQVQAVWLRKYFVLLGFF